LFTFFWDSKSIGEQTALALPGSAFFADERACARAADVRLDHKDDSAARRLHYGAANYD
jgi:hypothetical protein